MALTAVTEVGALLRLGGGSERLEIDFNICGMVIRSNDLATNVLLR
jgi:hypothetical protein